MQKIQFVVSVPFEEFKRQNPSANRGVWLEAECAEHVGHDKKYSGLSASLFNQKGACDFKKGRSRVECKTFRGALPVKSQNGETREQLINRWYKMATATRYCFAWASGRKHDGDKVTALYCTREEARAIIAATFKEQKDGGLRWDMGPNLFEMAAEKAVRNL